MSPSAALEALRAAVIEGAGTQIAKFTELAIRAGVSDAAIRSVVGRARRESVNELPAVSVSLADPMRWVANGFDLTLLEEAGEGVAPLSRSALRVLGVGFRGDLLKAIHRVMGLDAATSEVEALLARAREEGEVSAVLAGAEEGEPGWQFLASRSAEDRLRVLLHRSGGARNAVLEERADRADTLASINHELANTMTVIASTAAKAKRDSVDGRELEATIGMIDETARGALDSIHAMRRALRGDPSLRPGVRDLSPIFGDLVDALRPLAEKVNIEVKTRFATALDARVANADLRVIVWNLLKNAIEAGRPGGTINVGASISGSRLRMVVTDDGPGMDSDLIDRAFDPYFSTKESGMGLGLPAVKDVVERLEGELTLESKVGQGSRFAITLPRALPEARGALSSGLRSRVGKLSGERILLASEGLRVPTRALEAEGALLEQVRHVAEAEMLQGAFSIAIVDAILDQNAGIWFAQRLRASGKARRVLLISDRIEPIPVPGVDAVLGRGFGISELMDALHPEDPRDAADTRDTLRPMRERKLS